MSGHLAYYVCGGRYPTEWRAQRAARIVNLRAKTGFGFVKASLFEIASDVVKAMISQFCVWQLVQSASFEIGHSLLFETRAGNVFAAIAKISLTWLITV